jgi:integrase
MATAPLFALEVPAITLRPYLEEAITTVLEAWKGPAHLALDKALRLGLVAYNVTDRVDAPPVDRTERPTWTADQARRFLDAIVGDELEALYVTEIYTGMREGELLALKWSEVDLKAGTLRVAATLSYIKGEFLFTPPKTRRSRRTIPLAAPVIEALLAHRARQLARKMRLRVVWDDTYDLVLPTGIGRPIEATNFLKRSFYPLVEKAGVPRIHQVLRGGNPSLER